jgi:hypothetical protein
MDDGKAVAHALGDLQRVGAHQDGAAPLDELAEELLEQPGTLRVEPYHGLVHDDHLGPVHQRAGDDELLPHAVAVGLGQLILPAGELEQLQQLVDTPLDRGSLLAIQGGREAEKLTTGQLVVDEGPIRNEAEASLGLERPAQDVDSADLNRSAGRPENAGDHAKGGRLPRAVRAQEAEQLAGRNDQVDVVDGGELSVAFGQLNQPDQAFLRTIASTRSRSASRSTTMRSSNGQPPEPSGNVSARSVAASSVVS